MIGFRHVMLSVGKLFTQLLSSLNLVSGDIVGMIDEVNGDNVIYGGGYAFAGDNLGYYQLTFPDDKLRDGFVLECWYKPEASGGALIHSDDRVGNERRFHIAASQSGVSVTLIGSGVSVHSLSLTGGNIGVFWKRLKITYVTATSIEIISETDTLNEATTVTIGGGALSNALIRFGAGFAGGTNAPTGQNTGCLADFNIINDAGDRLRNPLSEPILDETNHTAFGVVSGTASDATLFLGSLNNFTKQDVFAYEQRGVLNKTITQVVPIYDDDSAFADGTALSDPDAIYEPGAFLNTGTEQENANIQELKDKDTHNLWYDGGGVPKKATFGEIKTAIQTWPEIYGGEIVADESIKNISLK